MANLPPPDPTTRREEPTVGDMMKASGDPSLQHTEPVGMSKEHKQKLRWENLSTTADVCAVIVSLAAVLTIAAGVWMLVAGASEGESGGYRGFEYVVVWQPFGALLVALGLIVGPAAALVCRMIALTTWERSEA